jgi:hypothetical protein
MNVFNLKFAHAEIAIAAEAPINPLTYVQNVSFPYMEPYRGFRTVLHALNITTI